MESFKKQEIIYLNLLGGDYKIGKPDEKNKKADVCVVGGGLAGTFAAIAAARHGAKVVLMQDRLMPVVQSLFFPLLQILRR